MRKTLRNFAGATGLAGWIILLAMPACAPRQKAEPDKTVLRPVVTMVVPEPGAGRRRSFSGIARAGIQTPLSFRVGGEIIELPARRGLAVKAGDLIARLDTRDYELQVKQNEAQLAQASAQLEQAQAQYQRARQLYEAQNISRSELDAAEAAFKSAVAQEKLVRKTLELAHQHLEYCRLLAPVDGALAEVPVEVHQTVAAGQTVAVLSAGERIEVEAGVPETLIGQISAGQEALVIFDTLPDTVFTGRVVEVGIATGSAGSYPVKVRLLQQDQRIRLGMLGEVSFEFKTAADQNLLRVPPTAIVPAPDGTRYVWVYDAATSTVKRRAVRIGDLTSEGLAVLEGLQPGERIVVRGVHRITDGLRVKLLEHDLPNPAL